MNNYRRNSKPHSRLLPYATIRAAVSASAIL